MSFFTDKLSAFKTKLKSKRAKHTLKIAGGVRMGRRNTQVDQMFAERNKLFFLAQGMVDAVSDSANTDLDSVKVRQLDYWKVRLNLFDELATSPTPSGDDMNSSDKLIVHFCGNFDASLNVFPVLGGTGTGTAINLGDEFRVATAGVLKDQDESAFPVPVGMMVRALVNNPGQLGANWRLY